MKKLIIGLLALIALLVVISLFQQAKIKKIQRIKQGAVMSGQLQTPNSDKRIDEIIATAKKKYTDSMEASRRINELTKRISIICSNLADSQNCINLMQQIANDEKIIFALEKLNKAGVGIIITWYKPIKNEAIYFNGYGSLMIHEETDIRDIKKFFGLN